MVKTKFDKYLSDSQWHICKDNWDRAQQAVTESQFSLGNGIIGLRGTLEEIPYDARVGTYIAGVYDKVGAQVTELVNVPNPFVFKISYGGEKLDVVAMDVLSHYHSLDMKNGLLVRKTLYSSSHKKRFEYQSMRFISMADKNTGVLRVYVKPLDEAAELTVQTTIDTSVSNTGAVTEGRKQHFEISEVSRFENGDYTCVSTLEHGILIAYASSWSYQLKGKTYPIEDNIFKIKLKKNETICFTKVFTLNHSKDRNYVKMRNGVVNGYKRILKFGFNRLVNRHIKAWHGLWYDTDISVKGDDEIQKALRFNIYHMLICGGTGEGEFSIGARTLSGEGYHGHVFWDSEIFNIPFYIYTLPEVAKNFLLYRFNRLNKAHHIAKAQKYKGAMFPWESADTGQEETPTWAKDLDGTIIRIHTNEMEHHITADIAFSYWYYYIVTGDDEFMVTYGLEILFETAKFWASRVEYNKKTKFYEIRNVIGPDEFHVGVTNNAFTNMMAKWNLTTAYKMYYEFKKKYPKMHSAVVKKCRLPNKEVNDWKKIAPRIMTRTAKDGLIEQFDGFFKKKNVRVTEFNEYFMPRFPKSVKLIDIMKYQLVKQADVVMLLYLLSDRFSMKTKKVNYEYYLKRTLHKSSLSPSIYAAVGAELDDKITALQFFWVSANADLKNIHGNTHEGIHAASLGGTWQTTIHGFAGVRVMKGHVCVNPKLPHLWKSLCFRLKWKGYSVYFHVENKKVKIRFDSKRKTDSIEMTVFGKKHQLYANKMWEFKSKQKLTSVRTKK